MEYARQAELAQFQQAAVAWQEPNHDAFTMLRRHGGYADVDL